jgi:hypothetical protein
MADRGASDESSRDITVALMLDQLRAAGVIGPDPVATRPVASNQARPRLRRSVSELLSDQRSARHRAVEGRDLSTD